MAGELTESFNKGSSTDVSLLTVSCLADFEWNAEKDILSSSLSFPDASFVSHSSIFSDSCGSFSLL